MMHSIVISRPFVEKLAARVVGNVIMLCRPHMHSATSWFGRPRRPSADKPWSEGGFTFTPTRNYCDACQYLEVLPITCSCCSFEGATSAYAMENSPDEWVSYSSDVHLCSRCRKLEPFDQFSKYHWRLKDRYPYLHIHTTWSNIATVLSGRKGTNRETI